jgi:GT2 family glycosyltransferase
MTTRVSFIIPVKNDARRLKQCLEAVFRNQAAGVALEVIVADNGSTDESPDVAAAMGARVLSLPGLRVADLRNRAAAEASGDVLAFVDADHEIVPTWVTTAVAALEAEGVGAAGALYSAPSRGSWVQRMYGALRGHTTGVLEVGWLGSGNLAVRRAAYEAVNGFDTSLEACEDVDFCQRLRASGWRIIGDERLKSIHFGDPSTLRALFRAERWRGRDNIRVSLRGPLALRDLPSLLIPVVDLAAVATLTAGAFTWPMYGRPSLSAAVGSGLLLVVLAMLRAVRILVNAPSRNLLDVGQAFMVAMTYDLARAVALTTRAPHHRHAASPAHVPSV